MNHSRLFVLGNFLVLLITGCATYQKQPLVTHEIVREVEKLREESLDTELDELTFEQAAQLMSQKSPLLAQIKAKYEVAQSVADIKTPWFNPSIEVGQNFGSKLEPGAMGRNRPFVGLGFAIPLGGKLSKNDDLNQAKALRAFVEAQAQHRELYLELRELYTNLFLAYHKRKIQEDLVEASEKTLKLTKTLMDSGATTALDVGVIELNANKSQLEMIEISNEIEELRFKLSILLGIDVTQFARLSKKSLPAIEQSVPDYENLKGKLIANHLDLARIRSDYEVAEQNLRLEISKQYPDIRFGAEREKEVGEKKVVLGLGLGIDLPLFDRNQQGIVQAAKEREEVKQRYVTAVHKALSQLKKSYKNIKLNQERQQLLTQTIKPRAQGNLKIAEQALESGALDALKYLDVLRTFQETTKEVALIESDVRVAWIDLERVLGLPLISYPGEEEKETSNE